MFDTLTNSLQRVFRNLRGYGRISETNVQDALREVRLALLEADVHYQVARDFIARVKDKCVGEAVLDSVTPGQQIIARIHEELVALLGGACQDFNLAHRPATILLLGLHGAGKTTTAAKLARAWKASNRKVLLVAGDIRRPAAIDQLRILAGQVGVDVLAPEPGESVPDLGTRALKKARNELYDVMLVDTGGRFQIDTELVGELKNLRDVIHPDNVVLVLDAAIGQASVTVAETFHKEVGLTGLILTKLDGDARGGAALSVHAVTGCPILRVGTGERPDQLEAFYPDRMASRILGMGDIVSLVEKAQATVDPGMVEELDDSLKRGTLNLETFLLQMRQMKKMGPLQNLLELMPGAAQIPQEMRDQMLNSSGDDMKRAEAIILSMTLKERRNPDILNGRRRLRIARGSGTEVSEINDLLRRFDQARTMMKRMRKMQKRLPKSPPFR